MGTGQSESALSPFARPKRQEELLARLDEQPFLLVRDGLERILPDLTQLSRLSRLPIESNGAYDTLWAERRAAIRR